MTTKLRKSRTMKKKPTPKTPEVVSIESVIQTTDDGQVTLIKLSLGKNDLPLSEEQAVYTCFRLAGMLPNSLKAQLASKLISALGETFR